MTSEIDLPVIFTTVSTHPNESSLLVKNKKSYPHRLYTLDESHFETTDDSDISSFVNHSCHLPPICSMIVFFLLFGGVICLLLFLPSMNTEYSPEIHVYNETLSTPDENHPNISF